LDKIVAWLSFGNQIFKYSSVLELHLFQMNHILRSKDWAVLALSALQCNLLGIELDVASSIGFSSILLPIPHCIAFLQ